MLQLHFLFKLQELYAVIIHSLFVFFEELIISKLVLEFLEFDSQVGLWSFTLDEHSPQLRNLALELQIGFSENLNLISFTTEFFFHILERIYVGLELQLQLMI
jgi:hypothetical protein